MRARRAL